MYTSAGSPAAVHGISTNVAGWNAWIKVPGEFENTSDGQYNKCQDEERYVTIFGAALASAGMPNHAIVDTGRNAVQGLRDAWGDWCNVNGAGFGVRPTSDTGVTLADAFVWVKPGGESDGTSDSSATRYDSMCGLDDGAYMTSSYSRSTWSDSNINSLQAIARSRLMEPGLLRDAVEECEPAILSVGLRYGAHTSLCVDVLHAAEIYECIPQLFVNIWAMPICPRRTEGQRVLPR